MVIFAIYLPAISKEFCRLFEIGISIHSVYELNMTMCGTIDKSNLCMLA